MKKTSGLLAETIEKIVRPKNTPGVDWGAESWILVVDEWDRALIWQGGHHGWASILEPKHYYPSNLTLVQSWKRVGLDKTLHDGGRLSAKLVADHSVEIAKHFDVPADWLLPFLDHVFKQGKTLKIVRQEP